MTVIRGYAAASELPVLDRFAWFLRVAGKSPATIKSYRAAVTRYLCFEADLGPKAAVSGSPDPLMRFIATRRDAVRPATVNIEVYALRCWFRWLAQNEPSAWQPVRLPRRRRVPVRTVRALSDPEVGMLLAQPDLTTFVGFRDHVMMAILYQCGLRAGELAGLQVGSIHPDGYLIVLGKGNKERLVPIGEHCLGLLETYLRCRAKTGPGKRVALWTTARGRTLQDARSVWVIVNRHARRALGVGGGYGRLETAMGARPWRGHYPHLLRASFATELHRRGVNLVALAQLLGHASVVTTALYLGIDLEQLRQAVAHHPRAKRQQ